MISRTQLKRLYRKSFCADLAERAFYRGTALHIFYGLDRFSEDLDFSLLEKEIRSHGLNFRIETKEKSVDTDIKSAFLKGNTIEHIGDVKEMLCNRFASINYVQAKQDVEPFIKNSGALDIWNADFFSQITQGLKEDIR